MTGEQTGSSVSGSYCPTVEPDTAHVFTIRTGTEPSSQSELEKEAF